MSEEKEGDSSSFEYESRNIMKLIKLEQNQ